jgi:hypothetical protein
MKRFFILLVLCVSTLFTFADTAYEKKIEEILMKYYTIFKYGYQRPPSSEDYMTVAFGGMELVMLEYALEYPNQYATLLKQMEIEMERAEGLMTDEDRLKEWKKSDYGKMTTWIQDQYSSKFTKDEFETSKQFYTRIEPVAKSLFNELCVTLYEQITQSLKIQISPVGYDAEIQTSTVKICETFKYNDNELKKEFSIKLQIPSQQARKFKEYEVSGSQIKNIKFGIIDNKEVYVISAQVPFLLGSNRDGDQMINIKYPDSKKATSFVFNSKQIDKNAPWEIFWNAEKIEESKKLISQYNKVLNDSVSAYKIKLGKHPYFHISLGININTNDFLLPKTMIGASTQDIKTAYNKNLSKLSEEYHKLYNSIENICKTKFSKHYADVYCQLHPDFAVKVDSIQHSYRCKYTTTEVAITLLANEVFDEPTCQETQYSENTKLFKSKKEFLQLYDELSSEDFTQELNNRTKKINYLDEKFNTEDFKNLIFLDAKILGNPKLIAFIDKYEELKEMCNYPVSEFINHNTKMLKEYQKSTNYWSSMDEFFEAYISGNYKQILKNKKKQK